MKKLFLFMAFLLGMNMTAGAQTATDNYFDVANFASIDRAIEQSGWSYDNLKKFYETRTYTEDGPIWVSFPFFYLYSASHHATSSPGFLNWVDRNPVGTLNTVYDSWTNSSPSNDAPYLGSSYYFVDNSKAIVLGNTSNTVRKSLIFYVTNVSGLCVSGYSGPTGGSNDKAVEVSIYRCTKNDDGTFTEETREIFRRYATARKDFIIHTTALYRDRYYKIECSYVCNNLYEIAFRTRMDAKIVAEPTSLDFGTTTVGTTVEKTFNVSGTSLQNDITASITNGSDNFILDESNVTITKVEATSEGGKNVTVKFTPTIEGQLTGTLTLSSPGASDVTVSLSGEAVKSQIIASPSSLDFGTTTLGVPVTKTITVSGNFLQDDIIASIDNNNFTIDNVSVSVEDASTEGGKEVTLTFTPITTGNITGTLTLSSLNADDVIVNLSGEVSIPVLTATPENLDMNANVGGLLNQETKEIKVFGQYLGGDVTVTLEDENHVFTLDTETISKEEAQSEDGKTIKVTFKPTVKGDYSGIITISSTQAEDVKVYISATAGEAFTVKISSVGLTTLYLDKPLEIPYEDYDPDLLGVYYIYAMNGTEMRAARLNNTIPANTAVIIQGNSGSYDFPVIGEADPLPSSRPNSYLSGCLVNTAVADVIAATPGTVYTLGRGSDHYINFYKYTGTTLNANKAYYLLPSGNSAKALTLTFDDAESEVTGINTVGAKAENGAWYSIQGVQLQGKPATKGIYIHNGKAVIVK